MLYFQHRRIWTYAVKFSSHLGAFYAKKNLKTRKKTQKSKVTKQAPNLDELLGDKAGRGVTKPTMCCESRSISKAETGWFLFKRSDKFRAEYCNCYIPIIIYWEFPARWSMKEAENRFLILGSMGPGTCLAWRNMPTQFLSFALSVTAPSPPPSAVADPGDLVT